MHHVKPDFAQIEGSTVLCCAVIRATGTRKERNTIQGACQPEELGFLVETKGTAAPGQPSKGTVQLYA